MPPEQVARLQSGAAHGAPGFAVRGAQVYERNRCGVCHMVNGAGAKIGPPLNGLSERRGRSWVLDHFARPQALSPGTIMPPYKLPSQELEDVTAYLFSLPE
jgi:mono/diheme cytochrome c family protein